MNRAERRREAVHQALWDVGLFLPGAGPVRETVVVQFPCARVQSLVNGFVRVISTGCGDRFLDAIDVQRRTSKLVVEMVINL
jgi:hypothetical protein